MPEQLNRNRFWLENEGVTALRRRGPAIGLRDWKLRIQECFRSLLVPVRLRPSAVVAPLHRDLRRNAFDRCRILYNCGCYGKRASPMD